MRMDYNGVEVCLLRPEKYLLCLVFRLFNHQFSPLKFLVHFAAVIRHTQKLEWGAALMSMAEQLKMRRLTRFCLYLAHDLLGICIPFEGVRVAHVEAGLWLRDMDMKEEITRLCTDVLCDYLFTTDHFANDNLRAEGVAEEKIVFVGNVMIDTLMKHRQMAAGLTW